MIKNNLNRSTWGIYFLFFLHLCGFFIFSHTTLSAAEQSSYPLVPNNLIIEFVDSDITRYISFDTVRANTNQYIVSTTPWTSGEHAFKGIYLPDLIRLATGNTVKLHENARLVCYGMDGYYATIHYSFLKKYPLILACSMDKKKLTIERNGPFWIVLPYKDFPNLDTPYNHFLWVRHVHHIKVYNPF